jgi:cell wall-associated NlpC family hydrolase
MENLREGDCLLYKPASVFGWIIKLKTWHPISHVEVYAGDGKSWASRDGKGVGLYPYRDSGLVGVYRPTVELDLPALRAYGVKMLGTPYGWADLLAFVGVTKDFKGIICSTFVTLLYRAGGFDPFNGEDALAIAPFEFELCPLMRKING